MKKSFEIDSDCLNIVGRLKAIDKNYFVIFNIVSKKFELHSRSQGRNSYCLTLPYDVLDERTVLYVLKTRVQNLDNLLIEMEKDNATLRTKQINKVFDDFKEKLYVG